MREGMSDLVILILLLGISFGVAFSSLIKVIDTQKMGYNETLEDKSISKSSVSSADDLYTGDMNLYEALLTLQVQDEKMDYPRTISIDDTCILNVDGVYKNVLLTNTVAFYNAANKRWGNSTSNTYNFVYTFKENDSGTEIEDEYQLVKTN